MQFHRTGPALALGLGIAMALSTIAMPLRADDAAAGCEPGGELRGDADSGADLHNRYCVSCHGIDGRGDVGSVQSAAPPKDQSDPAYMSGLSDEFLYKAICGGGEAVGRHYLMPAWGDVLSDSDIKDLIAYVRSFSGT